jgi:molybdate transport system ATP-binding protein
VDRTLASRTLSATIHKSRRTSSAIFELDVSLNISPGITILFGPSGAGKSTLLDCLAGLATPDAGLIAIGPEVLFDSGSRINLAPQKRRVAYVFQTLALFPHMTVEENIKFGLSTLDDPERRERTSEILSAFRIEKIRHQKPEKISGGEKQRAALARSLVTRPQVLLLDEPLTGLDAELKHSVVDDLRAWNAANSIPILYVTHSRDEVDALGERVIAMDRGRIVGEGVPQDVLDAPRRKRLAQAAGFENILNGVVVELRKPDGVMSVRLSGSACEIEVPLGYAAPGDAVQIAVRAGDILLATGRPTGLSARNIIEGRVVSMEQRGTMVVARVDCGVLFTVHFTPGARRALDLALGRSVWLVLKTYSCHLVQD